jgi:hypothetical protein
MIAGRRSIIPFHGAPGVVGLRTGQDDLALERVRKACRRSGSMWRTALVDQWGPPTAAC